MVPIKKADIINYKKRAVQSAKSIWLFMKVWLCNKQGFVGRKANKLQKKQKMTK